MIDPSMRLDVIKSYKTLKQEESKMTAEAFSKTSDEEMRRTEAKL